MNYEIAAERYEHVRTEIEKTQQRHKAELASLKEKQALLENWFAAKAHEDGIETVKTQYGTAYWSTHHRASVASREDFFTFCKENDAWELVEARASKKAVSDHLEEHGELPPGINYNTVRVFNFRKNPRK